MKYLENDVMWYKYNYAPYLLSLETTFLKACSQAYILITLMPEMTSFMTRTRWSVTRADLNLRWEKSGENEKEGRQEEENGSGCGQWSEEEGMGGVGGGREGQSKKNVFEKTGGGEKRKEEG